MNCWALDDISTTPMLEVVTSETLAALAGVTPRGSDASATAAVPAMERLMRLGLGTTTDENQGISLVLPIAYANSSVLTNHLSPILPAIASVIG